MLLGEKLQLLRQLEGTLRGLNRSLTKSEVIRLLEEETGEKLSQAYLSQLESGKRPHMTEKTRDILARFYKVHPGFFVSDPEGYEVTLSLVCGLEKRLDTWIFAGVEEFRHEDPELASALQLLAEHQTTRGLILLLAELVKSPEIFPQLKDAIGSKKGEYN